MVFQGEIVSHIRSKKKEFEGVPDPYTIFFLHVHFENIGLSIYMFDLLHVKKKYFWDFCSMENKTFTEKKFQIGTSKV